VESNQESQEHVARLAKSTGATEQEARVLYYLQGASKAWDDLPSEEPRAPEELRFYIHYQALFDMMLARIARRDHPEAWSRSRKPESEGI